MEANEYQQDAARTLISNEAVPQFPGPAIGIMLEWLWLAADLGEQVDGWKKQIFHQHGPADPMAAAADLHRLIGSAQEARDRLCVAPNGLVQRMQTHTGQRPQLVRLLWNLSGLIGETGEIGQRIMECVDGDQPLEYHLLAEELGDLLWYVAALCSVSGYTLSDVMEANIRKLRSRYPEGWDAARSQQRESVGAAP